LNNNADDGAFIEISSSFFKHDFVDDYYIGRFLRARPKSYTDAMTMLKNHIQWRHDMNVDEIYSEDDDDDYIFFFLAMVFDEVESLKKFYPHGYHGTDRVGRPLYIECSGKMHLTELFKVSTLDRLLKYFIQSYEILIRKKFNHCGGIKHCMTVIDLSGAGMNLFNSQVKNDDDDDDFFVFRLRKQ
jgi:hypothetical protein